jgi:hypothetical protein
MASDLMSRMHLVAALYPVADAFAGGVDTDVVALRDYSKATLVVMTGAIEDSGISNLVTINACTDNAKTGATAIAFRSRRCLSSTTVDTWGALTARTSSGHNFATASGGAVANNIWLCEVDSDEVLAGLAGAAFVYATIAETANKTITACAFWILSEPRYPGALPQTAIA